MSRRTSNPSAEEAILGTLLAGPEAEDRWQAVEDLPPEAFQMERDRILYGRMAVLRDDARQQQAWPPFSFASLVAQMGQDDTLERVGGLGRLSALLDRTEPLGSVLGAHVLVVRQTWERRRLAEACGKIADDIQREDGPAHAELMTEARLVVQRATETSGDDSIVWMSDLALPAYRAISDKTIGAPVKTGLKDVDTRVRPMRGEVTVVVARPSMGKTAAMLQLCVGAAKNGAGVLIDSREMPPMSLVARLLTAESGCNVRDLRDDEASHIMGGQEWDRQMFKVVEAADRLHPLPLAFVRRPSGTVESIAATARKVKAKHGLDVLAIDYLQLIPMTKGTRDEAGLAHITRSLKNLAQELEIWIILLSQLNREIEKRPNKRPLPSDIKGSGAVEADADHIMTLYRPIYYTAKAEGKEEDSYPDEVRRAAEWGWVKVREGSCGTDHKWWFGERQRFEKPAPGWAEHD